MTGRRCRRVLRALLWPALCAALLVHAGASAEERLSPVGFWTTIDDDTGKPRALVQLVEVDGALEGSILKVFLRPGEPPDAVCSACDDARHNQPIVGMTFLTGLKPSGDVSTWSGGTILDPSSGKIYRSQATLSENGQLLMVRGYIGFALLGRTQTWVRAKP